MGAKGSCVFVLKDDLKCYKVVCEMLRHCEYEVLHVGGAFDVVDAIVETKDRLELVLTNAQKSGPVAYEVIRRMEKNNLSVKMMSLDEKELAWRGKPFSFAAYVVNGLCTEDLHNMWSSAVKRVKAKMLAAVSNQEGNVQRAGTPNNSVEGEMENFNQKGKRDEQEDNNDKSEGTREDPAVAKKPRVMWTTEMHNKFLGAINILGYAKAVPKKIVEVMNIPGLTRENVASHLQKFRGGLKRPQEIDPSSLSGGSTTKETGSSRGFPSYSTSRRGPLRSSSYLAKESMPLPLSRAEEAINSFKSRYLSISETEPLGTTSNRNNQANFRIYGDQKKNVLLCTGKSSGNCDKSISGNFVGYRLACDGSSIQFGTSHDKIEVETSGNQFSVKTEDQTGRILSPVNSVSETAVNGISRNSPSGNDIPIQINPWTPPSIFQHDQDFLLQTPENDFPVQNSMTFEGTLKQHSSPSPLSQMLQDFDDFLNQGGIDDDDSPVFDWEEFEGTIVTNDDCEN